MKSEELPDDTRLRIMVRAGGCAGFSYDMSFDSEFIEERDILFSEYGVTLVSDRKTLALIRGTSIDYVETLQSSGFKFNNPNATATCGCEKSFT